MATPVGPGEHAFKLSLLIQQASPMMLDKLKREFQKLSGAIELVTKATKDWRAITATAGLALAGVALAVVSAAKEIIFTTDKIAIMGQRFGMTRAEIFKFNNELYSLGARSGVVADQIGEMANQLIEAGFKGKTEDLAKLSVTVYKFAEVTGLSAGVATDFAAGLSRMGINADSILKRLGGLRSSLQLSNKEFELAVQISKEATTAMYAFGSSMRVTERDMKKFGENMGNLAAMMQSIGVSAETTSKLMKGMIDPMAWLDNPVLMVNLGIGLDEVNNNLAGMSTSLQNNAEVMLRVRDRARAMISSMSPMGLALYAKTLNTTAADLRILANQTTETILKQDRMVRQQKELNELWTNMGETITPLKRSIAELFSAFLVAIKPGVDAISFLITLVAKLMQSIVTLSTDPLKGLQSMWDGLVKNFTIGGAVISGIVIGAFIWLGVWVAKLAGQFLALGANVEKIANNFTGMTGTTAQSTAGFEALAASISRVGIQLTDINAKMKEYLLLANATKTGGAAAPIIGAAIPTAAIGQNLQQQSQQQGSKAGAIFGRGFAKAFGALAVVGTMASVFTQKKFTISDLAMLALSLGPMLGPVIGPWVMGIGLAVLLLTQVFPKLNVDLLGGMLGGKAKAKGVAHATTGGATGIMESMKRSQAESVNAARMAESDRDERMLAKLDSIAKHTGSTVTAISTQDKNNVMTARSGRDYLDRKSASAKAEEFNAKKRA